jgi:tripartite-type tricarboxylate transporter receptor subunit TctC
MKRILLALVFLLVCSFNLQAQTPFYQGKTIRVVVGFTPGGFYDRWARLLAQYMPKYIPGSPEMIVQNMPGAGSVIAANYVYSVAKPDGLTVVMPNSNIYMDQVVGRKEVKFDLLKFIAVGTQEKSHLVLYMRADAPYKSIGDIIKAKESPKCGATGTAGADYILAKILEVTLGAKINSVLGYPGGSEIDVAVERGEVVCRGMTIPPHFGREPFMTWHKEGFDRHIVQGGRKRDSRAPDTPTVYELMSEYKTPEMSRRVAEVLLAGGEFGRFMFAPPGTPVEQVKTLRDAYTKAMNDPQLLAEAKKGKMDVDPTPGEELQGMVRKAMDQPPEVIEGVKKILGK